MFAVLAPLRNSLIIEPEDVSNTRIKVPCMKTKQGNAFISLYVTILATNKNTAMGTHTPAYTCDP